MAAVRAHDDLVARVVAWHNRNPLARRITPAQVMSVGLVSFPFWVPAGDAPPAPVENADESTAAQAGDGATGGSRLRERARARASQGKPEVQVHRATGDVPRSRRKAWRAAFTEDLLDPQSPQQVARWALRHGSAQRPGPADAPVREIEADGPRGAALARLWVFTAAIDLGAQRVRVLVSPLDARKALGPRIVGQRRAGALIAGALCAVAAAAVVALVVTPGLGAWRSPGAPAVLSAAAPVAAAAVPAPPSAPTSAPIPAPIPPAAPASAPAAGVPASAAAIAPSPAPTSAGRDDAHRAPAAPPVAPAAQAAPAGPAGLKRHGDPVVASAEGTATAAAAQSESAAPAPQPAERSRVAPMRHVVPFLSEAARQAAREASDAARADRARLNPRAPRADPPVTAAAARPAQPAAAAAVPASPDAPPAARAPAATPAPARSPATSPPARAAVPPPAPPATAWAVSTRNLRTRFESEQMLAALRDAAYRSGHGSDLKLEVLPAGDDWRAVGWPFASRADAERLRAALAARGLKAEVVQF